MESDLHTSKQPEGVPRVHQELTSKKCQIYIKIYLRIRSGARLK